MANPQELFNVDHKPITDGSVQAAGHLRWCAARQEGRRRQGPTTAGARRAPVDGAVQRSRIGEAERVEKARLARMAGQARESQVFFRLQLKAAPREAVPAEAAP